MFAYYPFFLFRTPVCSLCYSGSLNFFRTVLSRMSLSYLVAHDKLLLPSLISGRIPSYLCRRFFYQLEILHPLLSFPKLHSSSSGTFFTSPSFHLLFRSASGKMLFTSFVSLALASAAYAVPAPQLHKRVDDLVCPCAPCP